jgi:hypothetical protein
LHNKHQAEVEDYNVYTENLDRGKFNTKLKRLTFELTKDAKQIDSSLDELRKRLAWLRVMIDGAKRDMEEENY